MTRQQMSRKSRMRNLLQPRRERKARQWGRYLSRARRLQINQRKIMRIFSPGIAGYIASLLEVELPRYAHIFSIRPSNDATNEFDCVELSH